MSPLTQAKVEWASGAGVGFVDTLFSHDVNTEVDALVADKDGARPGNDLADLILTLPAKAASNRLGHVSDATGWPSA